MRCRWELFKKVAVGLCLPLRVMPTQGASQWFWAPVAQLELEMTPWRLTWRAAGKYGMP